MGIKIHEGSLHNEAEYGAQPSVPGIRVYFAPIELAGIELQMQSKPMRAKTILEVV